MKQEKPKIRLFVPQPFTAGETLTLSENQSHYAAHVMRLNADDALLVFNGADGEWRADIETIGKREVTIKLAQQVRKQSSAPDVWLVFAPIKNKTEFVAEKATELGVVKILPVLTRHSVVKSVNREKLEANIVEAAEQCERLDIPALENLEDLPHLLAKWPSNRELLYADESGDGVALKQLLPAFSAAPIAVLIGPEGGFSKEEQRLLKSKPFVQSFTMGPRILRADTASIAALACVQAWLGDWEDKPYFEARA
jgi:16S rRNA (uracil1498-N3)-methyltransferase